MQKKEKKLIVTYTSTKEKTINKALENIINSKYGNGHKKS